MPDLDNGNLKIANNALKDVSFYLSYDDIDLYLKTMGKKNKPALKRLLSRLKKEGFLEE